MFPSPESELEDDQSVVSSEPTGQTIRRPIPVSTIDWQTSMTSHFTPMQGLEFLQTVHQLIIQQTVELADVMASLDSENRYTVKVPRGETIFYATENSTSFQRSCFGSGRAFTMRLYDPSQQEAVQYKRRLACGSWFSICPFLQELEVWVPPGIYIGRIAQNFSASKPNFSLYNKHHDVIYKIEGPDSACGCFMNKNNHFQIFSSDGSTQIGSIVHQWDQVQVAYNLHVQMPAHEAIAEHKAILLGAAFLLEYMYFESTKKRSVCKCVC